MTWFSARPAGKNKLCTAVQLFVIVPDRSRPSTPIAEVLQNRFAQDWSKSMQEKQAQLDKDRADAAVSFDVRGRRT